MHTLEGIKEDQQSWSEIIKPNEGFLHFKIKDVWRYRDLLTLLVRRDFIATYKQTILGPIWFFIQPILTTITFMIVFNGMGNISTDHLPPILFYLAGLTLWNYFADCLNKTATVLKDNSEIFGKVYFPRLVVPVSIIISNLIKLGIQFILFLAIWAFYLFTSDIIHPNAILLLFPVLVLIMGGLGLGLGMIITAMTTKYRDMVFLLTFGVQLLMYATPVIYPLSSVSGWKRNILLANPMSSIIETFKYGFLGHGDLSWAALGYSTGFMLVVMIIGIIVFNKVEKSFMDTV